jgi:hypothetical protein
MTTEELLLEKWRTLPSEKQREVLAFVEHLTQPSPATDSPLGQISMLSANFKAIAHIFSKS